MPIQHQVLFKFPDLVDSSADRKEMDAVVAKFNTLEGIVATFANAGTKTLSVEELYKTVEWPDKRDGFTHSLFVVCEDTQALKRYLHSDYHLKDWIAIAKKYGKGIVVFDSEI